jgi:hypothetical protein
MSNVQCFTCKKSLDDTIDEIVDIYLEERGCDINVCEDCLGEYFDDISTSTVVGGQLSWDISTVPNEKFWKLRV